MNTYLSFKATSIKATSSGHHADEASRMAEVASLFAASDEIWTLSHTGIRDKLQNGDNCASRFHLYVGRWFTVFPFASSEC